MGKHCSNSQYFKEKKLQTKIFNQLKLKKKINKDNFEKKMKRKKKKEESNILSENKK